MSTVTTLGVDLGDLTRYLEQCFGNEPPVGALEGRTKMRDAIEVHYRISQLEAEQWVDTIVEQHLVTFEGAPSEPGVWHFHPEAAALLNVPDYRS